MGQRLEPIGEGLGLVLDRALLERAGISPETELEITADAGGLVIRPVDAARAGHAARVLESARRMAEVHRDTFRTLAE